MSEGEQVMIEGEQVIIEGKWWMSPLQVTLII